MPRNLVVGNGNFLINFDTDYHIRDIYYPFVGMENHSGGCVSRTGIWADGRFAWIDSPEWQKEMTYENDTLITRVIAVNPAFGLTLSFSDLVDSSIDIFIRRVDITNHLDHPRKVRLFFHYELQILGNKIGDTIYYHPEMSALVMYKEHRYFLAGGQVNRGFGISDWTTGSTGVGDKLIVRSDVEDGKLGRVTIANGFIEGVIGLYDDAVPAKGSSTMYHWMVVSTDFHGVEYLDNLVKEGGPDSFISRTRDYWRTWVNNESLDFVDLPIDIQDLYRHSLLLIRAQIDNRGAIIASTDSDITTLLKDTYSSMWTRDAAFVVRALDMANSKEFSQRFFDFCAHTITSDGYFLQKYNPDGSPSGQWMPWADEHGNLQLPIQEDETAVVIWCLWHHYKRYRDKEFVRSHYQGLVKNAANFMVSYRELYTKLPAPSYDLWEERRGIHLYTVAAVWASLQAAANLAELLDETSVFEQYRQAAAEIKEATIKYLFDEKSGRFLRSITVDADGRVDPDYTIDSSICGPFLFGMFEATEPRVETTMAAIIDKLWCKTEIGGMARYENDKYYLYHVGSKLLYCQGQHPGRS
jgi:GH15 family glucan-1,4-alpha-glucosidase